LRGRFCLAVRLISADNETPRANGKSAGHGLCWFWQVARTTGEQPLELIESDHHYNHKEPTMSHPEPVHAQTPQPPDPPVTPPDTPAPPTLPPDTIPDPTREPPTPPMQPIGDPPPGPNETPHVS
jgi:hypothetical protein